MFNKLRANPGMAIGAALFIVALIAVIVWIVRRGKKDKEGPSKPEITITGMSKTLKPDGQNKVEEYMMYEYNTATGPGTSTDPGTSTAVKGSQVATNIDLVLNWTNGTGFVTNNVSKLIFKRFVRPVDAAIDDKSGDIPVEDSTKHADSSSVGDFQSGEVTISGENLASSYTGGYKITTDQGHKNIIKIYYVDGNGVENYLTETNPIDISNNDLKRTLDIDEVESVTITVSPGDVAALQLAGGNRNMFYKIYSVPGAETPALKLSSVNTTSGNVKFTHNNSTYVFGIDFGTEDPFFKFEKISTDSDDLFLKVVDGGNANKYVVGTGAGFKLMTFDDIKSTGANFTNSRVRIVGNVNAGSISRPTDMTNVVSTPAASTTGFLVKDNYHTDIATGVTPAVIPGKQYKELGPGTSVEACRTLATDDGWKAYGFRKHNNTCWALKDVGIVSNGLKNDNNYAIGCTDAGKTIDDNCGYDVRKGYHVVRSSYDVADANGDNYTGESMDDCRKVAESKNWKTFGHRTKDHYQHPNTCWGITGTWTSGDIEASPNHSLGCTETGKMLANGCN
jgi:hypothetical protein